MKLYSVASVAALAMGIASSAAAEDDPYKETAAEDAEDADAPRTEDEAPSPDAVTEVSHSDRVLESRVYFEFDKSDLDEGAKAALQKAAGWLEGNEASLILIEGHTDKVGMEAYNKGLGQARAQASMDYLLSLGVDASRIKIISYGEALPVIETENKERKNRRIILYAVDKEPIVKTEYVEKDCPPPVTEVKTEYLPAPEPDVVVVEKEEDAFNFGILAGGGVVNSIDGETRRVTDPGGTWNARFSFNTKYVLGIEAAYVGSLQDLDDQQGYSDKMLVGNGVEGALRLNILQGAVRPYVFGGAGWSHYHVTNTNGGGDDTLTLPAGAGVDVKFAEEDENGFLIDFRGTIKPVLADDDLLVSPTADEEADLDNWSISAQAGYAF